MQTMKDGSSKPLYDNQVINIGNSTPALASVHLPLSGAEGIWRPPRSCRSFVGRAPRCTIIFASRCSREAILPPKRSRSDKPPPSMAVSAAFWRRRGGWGMPARSRSSAGINSTRSTKHYAWTPQNLSGVAYLRWDAKNLYVAVDVLDDIHHPGRRRRFGDRRRQPDPGLRSDEPLAGSRQQSRCAYYVSSQKPAGGSGQYTLWRPRLHAGGRPSGHLARDSSVYELIVKPDRRPMRLSAPHPVERVGHLAGVRREIRLLDPIERQRRPRPRRPNELGRRPLDSLASRQLRNHYACGAINPKGVSSQSPGLTAVAEYPG